MSIEVSIVMNAYNKYPQILFSLYALENQTFDHTKMEVIVVDDASTDDTPLIKSYSSPFKFVYIRCDKNTGRSKAKNIGLNAASGKVIIILDSEMIVDPTFVEQHHHYHQKEERLLVTGCMVHNGVYTTLNQQFNVEQLRQFHQLVRGKSRFLSTQSKSLLMKSPIQLQKILQGKGRLDIFDKMEINNQTYKYFSFRQPLREEVIKKHGSEYKGYYLPWYCVVTHNISFKRDLINEIGGFYEGFEGWGFEDWEFGYRVYKAGIKIYDDPNVQVYHQEHPISLVNQVKENYINYKKFLERHPNFDVGIHSLLLIGYLNFLSVNEVVTEYNYLVKNSPTHINQFINALMEIFFYIADSLVVGRDIKDLKQHLEITRGIDYINAVYKEREYIINTAKYPRLIEIFDKLLLL